MGPSISPRITRISRSGTRVLSNIRVAKKPMKMIAPIAMKASRTVGMSLTGVAAIISVSVDMTSSPLSFVVWAVALNVTLTFPISPALAVPEST